MKNGFCSVWLTDTVRDVLSYIFRGASCEGQEKCSTTDGRGVLGGGKYHKHNTGPRFRLIMYPNCLPSQYNIYIWPNVAATLAAAQGKPTCTQAHLGLRRCLSRQLRSRWERFWLLFQNVGPERPGCSRAWPSPFKWQSTTRQSVWILLYHLSADIQVITYKDNGFVVLIVNVTYFYITCTKYLLENKSLCFDVK